MFKSFQKFIFQILFLHLDIFRATMSFYSTSTIYAVKAEHKRIFSLVLFLFYLSLAQMYFYAGNEDLSQHIDGAKIILRLWTEKTF